MTLILRPCQADTRQLEEEAKATQASLMQRREQAALAQAKARSRFSTIPRSPS